MRLDEFKGRVVLVSIRERFATENEVLLGPGSPTFYAKVIETDSVGLWVENPEWEIELAPSGKKETHAVHVLLPWKEIISVGVFPDRTFGGESEKQVRRIGFHSG